MNTTLSLRYIDSSDLEFLDLIENDSALWRYSNTTEPYSKKVLTEYIKNAKEDITTAGQVRFVLIDSKMNRLGLVDLFDYKKNHSRAAIGIVILDKWRRNGYAKKGLQLVEKIAFENIHLHQLYAGISFDNKPSLKLFKSVGYLETGVKKDWNFYKNEFHDEIMVQKTLHA